MNVAVIGLGAMGGGMARRLIRSDAVSEVSGFDLNQTLCEEFYNEARKFGKATASMPSTLSVDRFVTAETNVVLIVLVNENQCESICFGNSNDDGTNLESLLRPGATVIVSSTVTPRFSKRSCLRFREKSINYLDCPISGGPIRSLAGEITIMASGDEEALSKVHPLFECMAKEIHIIKGGAGMGSTVKMTHQLLAGVHIAVAAEAMALAAKAGLDVRQLYDIVKGAAGASWMFNDRGKRMIEYDGENPEGEKVMSALAIFIKDLDIVYSSAKELRCPIPIATAALTQFISGSGLGLEKKDDSQVVKVYETLSGASVSKSASQLSQSAKQIKASETNCVDDNNNGDANVGDYFILNDGKKTKELIQEVADEVHHHVVISNEFTRVIKAIIGPNDTATAHKHSEDSLYFFLGEGDSMVLENHVFGCDPQRGAVDYGEVQYKQHKTDKPLIHRVTNLDSNKNFFCLDVEVLRSPPISRSIPLKADYHELVKTTDRCRVYRLNLKPGKTITVDYPFFFLSVVMKGSKIKHQIDELCWEVDHQVGEVEWNRPSKGYSITNFGKNNFEKFIAEWC